jgi:hypothetical protein
MFKWVLSSIILSAFVFESAFAQNAGLPQWNQSTGAFTPKNTVKPIKVRVGFDQDNGVARGNEIQFAEDNEEGTKEYSPKELEEYFNKLRITSELQARGSAGKRLLSHFPTPIHFGQQTFSFGFLLGGIAVYQTDYVTNPVAIDQFWDSLSDPIGNASFYTFMIGSGIAGDWLTDPRISVRQKKAYLKLIIPGLSMTAGSIVSSLTGDFLGLMKACHFDRVQKASARKALTLSATPKKQEGEADPCEVAWNEWTVKKKFHTYAPSIINMLGATLGGGLSNALIKAGLYEKRALSEGEKIVVNRLIKKAKVAIAKQLILRGVRYSFMFGPTGWITKVIGVGAELGNIYLFLKFDHQFRDATNWVYGNMVYGGDVFGKVGRYFIPGKNFQELSEDLYKTIKLEKETGFTPYERGEINEAMASLNEFNGMMEGYKAGRIYHGSLEFLDEFTETMEAWRKVNNADVEQAHQAWLDKVLGFMSSTALARDFYGFLIDDLKAKQTHDRDLKSGVAFAKAVQDFSSRTYPFFGVTPQKLPNTVKHPDDWAEMYTKNPQQLENWQKEAVGNVAQEACKTNTAGFLPADKEKLKSICEKLLSQDNRKMAEGLLDLNKEAIPDPRRTNPLNTSDFTLFLRKVREKLGNPQPVLYPFEGFTYAYEVKPLSQDRFATFQRPSERPWSFSKNTDYFVYKMVCGTVDPGEAITDSEGRRLQFNPPKIVEFKGNPTYKPDFCTQLPDNFRGNGETAYFYRRDFIVDGKKYAGIGNVILQNLNKDMQDIINSEDDEYKFDNWWAKKYDAAMEATYGKLKDQYIQIQILLLRNLNQRNTIFNRGVVENSLVETMKQELRVNLMIQGELLNSLIVKNKVPAEEIQKAKIVADIKTLTSIYPPSEKATEIQNKRLLFEGSGISKSDMLLEIQKVPWMLDAEAAVQGKIGKIYTFQALAETLMRDQEKIFSLLRFETETYKPEGKGAVTKVRLVNNFKPEAKETYEKNVKTYSQYVASIFTNLKLTDYQKEVLAKTQMNIERVLNQFNDYIRIAEALKYESNFDKDGRAKTPATSGTGQKTTPARGK